MINGCDNSCFFINSSNENHRESKWKGFHKNSKLKRPYCQTGKLFFSFIGEEKRHRNKKNIELDYTVLCSFFVFIVFFMDYKIAKKIISVYNILI